MGGGRKEPECSIFITSLVFRINFRKLFYVYNIDYLISDLGRRRQFKPSSQGQPTASGGSKNLG